MLTDILSSSMKPNPITTNSTGRVAYRLREASQLTGIPVSTFRSLIRRGEINPITGLGVWLISASDLEFLLNKRLRNATRTATRRPILPEQPLNNEHKQSTTRDNQPC